MRRLLFSVFIVVLFAISADAATYFVAPKTGGPGGTAAGSPSGTGSITSPWDLYTAFNNGGNPAGTIQPNDTIILRSGTYVGTFSQRNSGTVGHPVTITNYAADMVNWPQDLPTIDSFAELTLTSAMASTTSNTSATVSDASELHSGDELYIYDSSLPYTTLGERVRILSAPIGNTVIFIRALQSSPAKAHIVGEKIGIAGSEAGYVEVGSDVIVKNIRSTSTKPRRAIDWRRATYNGGATYLGTYNAWPYKRTSSFDVGSGSSTAGTRSIYVNLVADNGQQAFGWWVGSVNSKIYHALIVNGGIASTDRGHGHGLYTENTSGQKIGDGIISVNAFSTPMKVFASSASVMGVHYQNSIFATGGATVSTIKQVDRQNVSPGAGTVSFNSASTTVTFNAGATTATLMPDDEISPDGGTTWKVIASITDATHIVLTSAPPSTVTVDDTLAIPGYDTTPEFTVFYGTSTFTPRGTDLVFDRNAVYAFPVNGSVATMGQTGANSLELAFTNNTVDSHGFLLAAFDVVAATGNTIVQRGTNPLAGSNKIKYDRVPQATPTSINWDFNTYYYEATSANPFSTPGLPGSSGQKTFAQWKTEWANAGFTVDANSTAPGAPTGTKIIVTNDPWERGRFNVAIFNWSAAATVDVPVTAGWLRPGDAYRVYAAESFEEGPIATGVYNGASIPIPMAATTTSAPFGYNDSTGTPIHFPSTRPTFGAFIVMRIVQGAALNVDAFPGLTGIVARRNAQDALVDVNVVTPDSTGAGSLVTRYSDDNNYSYVEAKPTNTALAGTFSVTAGLATVVSTSTVTLSAGQQVLFASEPSTPRTVASQQDGTHFTLTTPIVTTASGTTAVVGGTVSWKRVVNGYAGPAPESTNITQVNVASPYKLSAKIEGDNVKIYVNDVLARADPDNSVDGFTERFLSGNLNVGLRSGLTGATWDNFQITTLGVAHAYQPQPAAAPVSGIANPPILPTTLSYPYSLPTGGSPAVQTTTVTAAQGMAGLQAAVDTAAASTAPNGHVIVVEAGATFTGTLHLPLRTNAGGWVYVISSALASLPAEGTRVSPLTSGNSRLPTYMTGRNDAQFMPHIVTTVVNDAAMDTIDGTNGTHHWRFVGLDFSSTYVHATNTVYNVVQLGGFNTPNPTLASAPHDIVIDRCWIHGNDQLNTQAGVRLNTGAVQVSDSYISEIHHRGSDAQALSMINGPGPFKIRNNYLEASGENIMMGGSGSMLQSLNPADLEFRFNYCFKPRRWQSGTAEYNAEPVASRIAWVVKNLFELKTGLRNLVEYNVFENCWTDGQTGEAIKVASINTGPSPWSQVTDLTFRKNLILNAEEGVQTIARDNPCNCTREWSQRQLYEDNVFLNITGKRAWYFSTGVPYIDPVTFIKDNRFHEDVTVRHNTMINPNVSIGVEITISGVRAQFDRFEYAHNIACYGKYGTIDANATGTGNPTLYRYIPGLATGASSYTDNVHFQTAGRSGAELAAYPGTQFYQGLIAGVGFTSTSGTLSTSVNPLDFVLDPATSPYDGVATDGGDIGARNITAMNATWLLVKSGVGPQ